MSDALRKAAEQAINALIEARSSMLDGMQQDKAINALRAALAAQTPPPRLTDAEVLKLTPHGIQHITDGVLIGFARAIENAFRAQLGIKDQEGGVV